jgi:acetyl esterase/lipase
MRLTQYTATKNHFLILTAICLVVFSSNASAQITWNQIAELEVPTATRTLQYGDSDIQVIDVFDPSDGGNGSYVMLIHGGCWLNQYDRFYMGHIASSLAENGTTVYNIEYRRVGDIGGGFPGTFEDVHAAYKAVSTDVLGSAEKQSNITIVGHSAGGHLALWLASADSTVHRVVGLAAISDLSEYARGTGNCQTAAPRLMGGSPEDIPAAYIASDPALIANPKAEIVLISAENDAIVPPSHNEGYKMKTNARHVVLSGVGHFDLVAPISSVWRQVLSVISDQ